MSLNFEIKSTQEGDEFKYMTIQAVRKLVIRCKETIYEPFDVLLVGYHLRFLNYERDLIRTQELKVARYFLKLWEDLVRRCADKYVRDRINMINEVLSSLDNDHYLYIFGLKLKHPSKCEHDMKTKIINEEIKGCCDCSGSSWGLGEYHSGTCPGYSIAGHEEVEINICIKCGCCDVEKYNRAPHTVEEFDISEFPTNYLKNNEMYNRELSDLIKRKDELVLP